MYPEMFSELGGVPLKKENENNSIAPLSPWDTTAVAADLGWIHYHLRLRKLEAEFGPINWVTSVDAIYRYKVIIYTYENTYAIEIHKADRARLFANYYYTQTAVSS